MLRGSICNFGRFVGFTSVLLFVCSCGFLPDASRSGVKETAALPGVVRIYIPGGGLCSGAFISPRAVLTAAHCTLNSGTYGISTDFGYFTTQNKVAYGPGTVNDPSDIAVLILDSRVVAMTASYVIPLSTQRAVPRETLRLIGYGCTNFDTGAGTNIKREGTNMVYRVASYIEFLTPTSTISQGTAVRGILGSSNRAGSCFGDSGSPLIRMNGTEAEVVGVAHAGGYSGDNLVSQFVDTFYGSNHDFLASVNQTYRLGIQGL